MSMKPIASRSYGWCVVPSEIRMEKTIIDATSEFTTIYICMETINTYEGGIASNHVSSDLPEGMTFAQFLDQYNHCTDNIYFID